LSIRIFTGTSTDPQLYKYEAKLLEHMREQIPQVHVSLHTNGLLALAKMQVFNKYDTVTLSINSFSPVIFQRLHGVKSMPDLAQIMKLATVPVKLSCVITDENYHHVNEYVEIAASVGVKRIAFRYLFGEENALHSSKYELFKDLTPVKLHSNNPVYNIHGVEVTNWCFDKTSGKSLNLFSNGTLSEEYLLVKSPSNVHKPTKQ